MFEDVSGRLISGALWGLGAGLVLSLMRNGERDPRRASAGAAARPLAKTMMKGYVTAADRLKQWTAEARENLEDVYAEVQAERGAGATAGAGLAEDGTRGDEAPGTTARRGRSRTTRINGEHEA